MGKRIPVHQMVQKKYKLVEGLSPEIVDAIGEIENTFTAIIYGGSGMGKTNFLVKLLKDLKPLGDMLYISYEEQHSKTVQDLILRHNLHNELPNLRFSDGETPKELYDLLKKKKSPKVIVMDSWQFSHFTLQDYEMLKKNFVFGKTPGKQKIFLIISHVNNTGKAPDGTSARDIKRDANIKILVEGFMAIVEVSRYGSKKNMVIWEYGAKEYWGEKMFKKLSGDKSEKPAKALRKAKQKEPAATEMPPPPEPVTHAKLLPELTEQERVEIAVEKMKADRKAEAYN